MVQKQILLGLHIRMTLFITEGYKAHIIIGGYFLMLPIFLALAYNNEHVSEILRVRAIVEQNKTKIHPLENHCLPFLISAFRSAGLLC